MELTWLGTAGFEIRTKNTVFYLDPYLSRNPNAIPVQEKSYRDCVSDAPIFVSHGHFDHLMDLPDIIRHTHSHVYGSGTVSLFLKENQTPPDHIHAVTDSGQTFEFDDFTAQSLFSQHVKFDLPLVIETLAHIHIRFFSCYELLKNYPCGQVLGWRFKLEDKTVLFFGSAGSSREELEELSRIPTDILLVPVQGHSKICRIAADYVEALSPKTVIPHHFDSFYPPISKWVDLSDFLNFVEAKRQTKVIVPEINRTIKL